MSKLGKTGLKILSCGAGMQSTALALMSCENKIKGLPYPHPEVPVYDFIKNACESCGIPFIILESGLYDDYIENFGYRTHAENSIEGPQHYHYGDEFKFDPDMTADMTARREAAFNELYKQEKAKGVRYPNIQLCVDETDPGLLHLLHRKFGPQGYCTIRTDTRDTIEDWIKSLTEPK